MFPKNHKTYFRFGYGVMAVVIVWLIFMFYHDFFGRHYTYYTILDNASGLQESDRVMINNMEVGFIDRISFVDNDPKNGIAVRLKIIKEVSIPHNSVVSVSKEGLFAEKRILCIHLYGSEGLLVDGDTILSELVMSRKISDYTGKYLDLGMDSVVSRLKDSGHENRVASYYSVQILVSGEELSKTDTRLKGLKGTEYYMDEGFYKYIWGRFGERSEALLARDSLISRGFAGAFVISLKNGKRVKK